MRPLSASRETPATGASCSGVKLTDATFRIYTSRCRKLPVKALLVTYIHAQYLLSFTLVFLLRMRQGPCMTVRLLLPRCFWIHSLACILRLQIEEEGGNSTRVLADVCIILFTASSQLQRLRVSICYNPVKRFVCLPYNLIIMMAFASSLESLILAIPQNVDFKTLAETVCSLRKLKVQ
jgi:hypothetical protein